MRATSTGYALQGGKVWRRLGLGFVEAIAPASWSPTETGRSRRRGPQAGWCLPMGWTVEACQP